MAGGGESRPATKLVAPAPGAQSTILSICARPLASVVTPVIVATTPGFASWPSACAHEVDERQLRP